MGLALVQQPSLWDVPEPLTYHDPERKGFVSILRKRPGDRMRQTTHKLEHLPQALSRLDWVGDIWVGQNEFFRPNRKLVYAARMPVNFLDLDTYNVPSLAALGPEAQCSAFLAECVDAGVPEPSLVVYSGRGLQVKWVLEDPAPSRAIPRWRSVQRDLLNRFRRFGADARALDVSRVLRLEGSTNSRSGDSARVLHRASVPTMGGSLRRDGLVVHAFDTLAETLLPFSRQELADMRAEAEDHRREWQKGVQAIQARRADLTLAAGASGNRHGSHANLRVFVRSQLAWDRIGDIRRLFELRGWTGGAPPGERDVPVFLAACFLAEAKLAKDVMSELRPLVRLLAPDWADSEIRDCVSSVLERAHAHARGETVDFRGKQVSPRYGHSNDSLIEKLCITPAEEREMQTIISKGEKRRRTNQRRTAQRREQGVVPRADYRQAAEHKRASAMSLKAQGMSLRTISTTLGIPLTSVQRYCASPQRNSP